MIHDMNDKMSRYNKQMGARKFPYDKLVVSLREAMGFLTRSYGFPYEKLEASNWGKSFSRLGTYVHRLMNLCSWAYEPMFMGKGTYVLRNMLLVVMMMIGVNVWGQMTEGFYYIANRANKADNVQNTNPYDGNNPSNNFYLCPAIGSYYDNNIDQPHLTTFRTNQDQNSLWKIEAVSGETNCYYLIHYKTGKYLKSNETPNYNIDGNKNRKVVHLEEKIVDDDSFKFYIVDKGNNIFQIYPKVYKPGGTLTQANGMSLNVKGDNWSMYVPQNGLATGIIGVYEYKNTNYGSQWAFESSSSIPCATPVIKYDGDNINISYPYTDETGITIYYTTDGTDPATSGTRSSYSSPISASNVVKVRAIATKTNYVNSDEAVLLGSARPFLIQSKECEDYYLVPSGNGNNVTTSSLPGTSMQWTLRHAGASTDGVPYYNLVNSNGKKINYDSSKNTLTMNEESADANKFCIIEDGNSGEFFIIPVNGVTTGNDKVCKNVFKNSGNVASNNVDVQNVTASSADNIKRSHWILRVCNVGADQKDLFSDPPFSVSDANEAHYYHIQSGGNSGYYIVPPSATDGYVQTSNSSSNYSDVPWVFKKAAEDNWLTYYYIINAATGQFMHFNLNDKQNGDGTNVVSMKDISEKSAANEDKFQYVMVPSTTEGACYIVPKGYSYADDDHINFRENKYYGLWENSGGALMTKWSRSSDGNNVKWTFSETTPLSFYIDPDITQDENGYVTISHLVNACDFYYTTDGTTTPVVPANGSDPVAPTYKYSGPFLPPLGASKIIAKAAIKGDHTVQSDVSSFSLPECATPTATLDTATGTLTIGSTTTDAIIYYTTDNTAPTLEDATSHDANPAITCMENKKTTVQAIAAKRGMKASEVLTQVVAYKPNITINGTYTYTGEEIEPTISSVTIDTEPIESNKYIVSDCSNNTNAGTAQATITESSTSDWIIYGTATFTIEKVALTTVTLATPTVVYNGLEQSTEITNVMAGSLTVPATDYTVSGNTGTDAGDYTVTATAKDETNFTGQATATFTIDSKSLGEVTLGEGITMTLAKESDNYVIIVKDGNKTLTAVTDYTMSGPVDAVPYHTWAVAGTGNYSGSVELTYVDLTLQTVVGGNGELGTTFVGNADMATPQGMTTYIVTSIDPTNQMAILQSVEYIPKDVPVLLLTMNDVSGFVKQSPNGVASITDEQETSNQLKVQSAVKELEAAEVYLFYKGEFVLNAAGNLPDGKVYLEKDSGGSPGKLRLVMRQTTDMKRIHQMDSRQIDGGWYTLDGRRLVGKPTMKGVYINDGHKLVIR